MKIDLGGHNFELDNKVRDYVTEKIGALEKYLPKVARDGASAAVTLEEDPSGREDNRFVCDAVMTVAGAKLVSREGTVNIYAAIDIVEAKLKAQLAKYKQKRWLEPRRGRMLSRWFGRLGRGAEAPAPEAVEPGSESAT